MFEPFEIVIFLLGKISAKQPSLKRNYAHFPRLVAN
jgi:hypothetical protein